MMQYIPLTVYPEFSPISGCVPTSKNLSPGERNIRGETFSTYIPDMRIPFPEDCSEVNTSSCGYSSSDSSGSCRGSGGGIDYSVHCDPEVSPGFRMGHFIHSPSLQLDGLRYEQGEGRLDPYSPLCMVPLPGALIEPGFIRRRNERERERVRCVNEGYDRLKEHLPLANRDKRISKVDTLRGAINYIRELQKLLQETEVDDKSCNKDNNFRSKRKHRHYSSSEDSESLDSL